MLPESIKTLIKFDHSMLFDSIKFTISECILNLLRTSGQFIDLRRKGLFQLEILMSL